MQLYSPSPPLHPTTTTVSPSLYEPDMRLGFLPLLPLLWTSVVGMSIQILTEV